MRDYEEKSFYEIQLDNKQLILVFLAALTVCVLIFVLGVMIGKGQKEAEMAALSKGETATAAAATPVEDVKIPNEPQPVADATSAKKKKPEKPVVKTAKQQDSSTTAAREERFAYQDLDKPEAEPDADAATTIKPETDKNEKKTQPKAAVAAAEKQPVIDASSPQYTVQVMATSSRDKAEQQMTTLRTNGYKPFMDQKAGSNGTIYKVRIGRFADTVAARQVAGRLKQDMKMETWVTVLD